MEWYLNLNYESDSINLGRSDDVSVMNDTTLFVFGGWGDIHDSTMIYVFKADSAGNLIDRKFLNHNGYYRGYSQITSDNKYVLVSYYYVGIESGYYDLHFFKLNAMLEYDTLYSQEFTYDSLCDHEIVSDTIPLDTLTVNLDRLARDLQHMKIYPNPANDKVRIEINIVRWKERQLKVFNLTGQVVYNSIIPPGRANHEINVSEWQEGLYVFRLYEEGSLIQTEKVLVVR